ncbi:asparagine synthase (glutamine-hydrolyzing) [Streptomyces olivaceiscleroticus]|uniref:asparagine synthase (glutamine-hydrolyzing) n=1 Tax=Streptomyces olivaceiscleroticus TaxID=68245 RepID=A0ABN0ZAE2_9ACTN
MCRIFGHFDARATPHELRTVAALQRHGGPDAQTRTSGAGWALGADRLAVVDLDGGAQPYTLGEDIVAVFNGEIYNHDELRDLLTARGHTFADRCDGSVIPALYQEFGPAFAEHLDGMFSVALVDLRTEPTLWLVTDDVGMKPLYHHWDEARGHLHFSSELPALLAFRGVTARPWEPGLDAYLATKTPFGEQTMFEGVQVLPPATTARFTRSGGLRLVRRPAPEHPDDADVQQDGEEAAERTLTLLRREVHRLTRADVPVSAVTSGGLDSGLVTALAAEDLADLHTFNIAYRGSWPCDERGYAREVAEHCATRHHQVEIDPADFPGLLPDVIWHLGQPNADPITLSTYALFRSVRDAGFTVALTGDAADELFGGYGRMKAAVDAPSGTDWVPPYVEALAAVPRELRASLYTADYRAFVRQEGSPADAIAARLRAAGTDRLRTLTDFEIGSRLPAYHLRRVDHLSMAASVEVRLPFCQRSVLRHARALPQEWKVAGGQGKKVLYRAAAGRLPDSVLRRPKQPFTLPIAAMLRPGAPLMEYARELLTGERLRRRGQLDPQRVARLIERQAETPDDTAALAIWSLLVHELWLEQFCPAPTGLPDSGGGAVGNPMTAHIAQAEGAPCPTVVLDADRLPRNEDVLRPALTTVREWLTDTGRGHVLKMALLNPSEHPLFDLDYRFVQALPGGLDRFDFRGNCGHSILAAIVAAEERGWLPRLAPGDRVRVRVLNNGDHVVCEVDEVRRHSGSFTVHFVQDTPLPVTRFLLTGHCTDQLLTRAGAHAASLVAVGNPYVFVDARSLGLTSKEALFAAGEHVFGRLQDIRTAATELLGLPGGGAFPKIAAVGGYEPGRLAVRAVSVPGWHPSVALTGATCLAAATTIAGTVPHRLAQEAGCPRGVIEIDTPSGSTAATAAVAAAAGPSHGEDDDSLALQWVSVSRKLAHLTGSARITSLCDFDQEDPVCRPLTA